MQYITIKDIARALNVSVATVSRAFNDRYDIKKETREMVLEKAREMGYKPNPIARKLLQKHSFNIGVIVPEFIHAFFPEVIIGIQEVLCKKNYQVIIMQSNESAELELANILSMEDNMVEGLLISLTKETRNINCLERLIKHKFPIVLFNRINDALATSKVIFNDYKWALFATEHLIEQGYRKIYHFAGPGHLTFTKNRTKGFQRAMEKHHISYEAHQIVETGISIADGEKAMEQLIERRQIPDAIFATNDPTALGAMKVLKRHGYRIPEEVGIIGFSNSKMAEVVEPALSSVEQPTFEMGKLAAQLLLDQLNATEDTAPETVVIDGKLVIRDSSVRQRKCNS